MEARHKSAGGLDDEEERKKAILERKEKFKEASKNLIKIGKL